MCLLANYKLAAARGEEEEVKNKENISFRKERKEETISS